MCRSSYLLLLMLTGEILVSPGTRAHGKYDDVAVIVNVNAPSSTQIGEYFRAQRGIPAANMIYVSTSVREEIDSTTFTQLRNQIESHLVLNNLRDSINFLVTTKGVPLKVNRGNTYSPTSPSSSLESELSLLLGPYANNIGKEGRFYSPLYASSVAFSHAQTGLYLVTRLDGYTVERVMDLIDHSGPQTIVATDAKYVFDQDPSWNSVAPYLNDYLTTAQTLLAAKGEDVVLNADSIYLTGHTKVLGYVSWGSNDRWADRYTSHAIPHHAWSDGALAETYVSTSGRSFDIPPVYGQSLIADLIEEGACGVKGYVYEPYSTSMANASILFDRYTSGFTLAESYYYASRYLSWMDVVIGDPKTTIARGEPALAVQLAGFEATSSLGSPVVSLTWSTISEVNNYGFFVQRSDGSDQQFNDLSNGFLAGHGTTVAKQEYTWADSSLVNGIFYYRLRQVDLDGRVHFSDPVRVTIAGVTAIVEPQRVTGFVLEQNYPNPFNPSTTIRYSIPERSRVRLEVYTLTGQVVATLVDAEQEAGTYSALFSPQGRPQLASGVYCYRLQAGVHTYSSQMVFVK